MSESRYVIRRYPCKPDIFEATYTVVENGRSVEGGSGAVS